MTAEMATRLLAWSEEVYQRHANWIEHGIPLVAPPNIGHPMPSAAVQASEPTTHDSARGGGSVSVVGNTRTGCRTADRGAPMEERLRVWSEAVRARHSDPDVDLSKPTDEQSIVHVTTGVVTRVDPTARTAGGSSASTSTSTTTVPCVVSPTGTVAVERRERGVALPMEERLKRWTADLLARREDGGTVSSEPPQEPSVVEGDAGEVMGEGDAGPEPVESHADDVGVCAADDPLRCLPMRERLLLWSQEIVERRKEQGLV